MIEKERIKNIERKEKSMKKRIVKEILNIGEKKRNVKIDKIGMRVEVVIKEVLKKNGEGEEMKGMENEILEKKKL